MAKIEEAIFSLLSIVKTVIKTDTEQTGTSNEIIMVKVGLLKRRETMGRG